jgi:hypothetical protein
MCAPKSVRAGTSEVTEVLRAACSAWCPYCCKKVQSTACSRHANLLNFLITTYIRRRRKEKEKQLASGPRVRKEYEKKKNLQRAGAHLARGLGKEADRRGQKALHFPPNFL